MSVPTSPRDHLPSDDGDTTAVDTVESDAIDHVLDPFLCPQDDSRFCLRPIRSQALYDLYVMQRNLIWSKEEIDFSSDLADWVKLNAAEQKAVKRILGFFANSDGVVEQNIEKSFSRITLPEARLVLDVQKFMEGIHSETYFLMLDIFVPDPEERAKLFSAVTEEVYVRPKFEWAKKWMSDTTDLATTLAAWAAVEAIMFSSSFAILFWLRNRGLLRGLSRSNEFISRDEALHWLTGATMFRLCKHRPSQERVYQLIGEAVELEEQFARECIEDGQLRGLSLDGMLLYIKNCADTLLKELGFPAKYNVQHPFHWATMPAIVSKANFFERDPDYVSGGGGKSASQGQVTFELGDMLD